MLLFFFFLKKGFVPLLLEWKGWEAEMQYSAVIVL
jgi:hypothetical protein